MTFGRASQFGKQCRLAGHAGRFVEHCHKRTPWRVDVHSVEQSDVAGRVDHLTQTLNSSGSRSRGHCPIDDYFL